MIFLTEEYMVSMPDTVLYAWESNSLKAAVALARNNVIEDDFRAARVVQWDPETDEREEIPKDEWPRDAR